MQKWEHCAIFNNIITFYRTANTLQVQIQRDKSKGDRNDGDAYNRAVAQLGLDGWQFAGMNGLATMFKRPIE